MSIRWIRTVKFYMKSIFKKSKFVKWFTEVATAGVLRKKLFLKISENSQEGICARVAFLIKLQALGLRPAALSKQRLCHRCFPVNFAEFLRTLFLHFRTTASGFTHTTIHKNLLIRSVKSGKEKPGGNHHYCFW